MQLLYFLLLSFLLDFLSPYLFTQQYQNLGVLKIFLGYLSISLASTITIRFQFKLTIKNY